MSFLMCQSRRTFLRHASQIAMTGAVAAPLLSNLDLIGKAAAATSNDYKALVCVFLHGGNDYANTLTPYDVDNYALYQAPRESIAIDRTDLAATALTAENDMGGRQFAFNPALAPLLPLFNSGNLAMLLNVGTLVEPTTRAQYFSGAVALPPKLFGHNSQRDYFSTCNAAVGAPGWGGRIGDFLQAYNTSPALTCINTGRKSIFIDGTDTSPYSLGTDGALSLLDGNSKLLGSSGLYNSLVSAMQTNSDNLFASAYADLTNRAQTLGDTVNSALDVVPASQFPMLSSNGSLYRQLRMVTRMIAAADQIGAKRQVFFVTLGGWDTHSYFSERHPVLLSGLGSALAAFYTSLDQLGLSSNVTTFTASDFGRTLSSNGDGTDHGWGSHHFILGGAVKGKRIYGTPPEVGLDTNDDVGRGRLIPSTSVDQYAATLASWFGVSNADLGLILPNLANFDSSSWNLGFV